MIWTDVIEQFIKLDRKKFRKIHPIFVKHEQQENTKEFFSENLFVLSQNTAIKRPLCKQIVLVEYLMTTKWANMVTGQVAERLATDIQLSTTRTKKETQQFLQPKKLEDFLAMIGPFSKID